MKAGPAFFLFVAVSGSIFVESQAQTNLLREPIHLDASHYRISPLFKRLALLTEEEKDRLIAPIRQSFDPDSHEIVISTNDATHRRLTPLLSIPPYRRNTRFELPPTTYPWQLQRRYFPK